MSAEKKTVQPNIHKPGKVLLHHIPLKFVTDKVAGGGKKAMNQEIPLIPFIDFLITLVVFLLMSFSASGEMVQQQQDITMPTAVHALDLEEAPVITIDKRVITVRGTRVADTPTLLSTPALERIEPMIQALEQAKRNWDTIHQSSGKLFPGIVIVQADQDIDYLAVKKVMFSSAQAGYANVSFAVNKGGD